MFYKRLLNLVTLSFFSINTFFCTIKLKNMDDSLEAQILRYINKVRHQYSIPILNLSSGIYQRASSIKSYKRLVDSKVNIEKYFYTVFLGKRVDYIYMFKMNDNNNLEEILNKIKKRNNDYCGLSYPDIKYFDSQIFEHKGDNFIALVLSNTPVGKPVNINTYGFKSIALKLVELNEGIPTQEISNIINDNNYSDKVDIKKKTNFYSIKSKLDYGYKNTNYVNINYGLYKFIDKVVGKSFHIKDTNLFSLVKKKVKSTIKSVVVQDIYESEDFTSEIILSNDKLVIIRNNILGGTLHIHDLDYIYYIFNLFFYKKFQYNFFSSNVFKVIIEVLISNEMYRNTHDIIFFKNNIYLNKISSILSEVYITLENFNLKYKLFSKNGDIALDCYLNNKELFKSRIIIR